MNLKMDVNMEGIRQRMNLLANPALYSALVGEVMARTHAKLTEWTPVRWTGNTRRGWIPKETTIENRTNAMGYLERGTPRSGTWIYPRVKKALFVPLTRQGAFFARAKATWGETEGGKDDEVEAGASIRYTTQKGNLKEKRITFGMDYVLARRVRGIKPRRIGARGQAYADALLVSKLEPLIRKVLSG